MRMFYQVVLILALIVGGRAVADSIYPAPAPAGLYTTTGALKGNGSGVISQAACGDLSNATGACSAPFISAGSWTPTDGSGASLLLTSVNAGYSRVGNMIFAYATVTYPSTVDGSNAKISGLPVNVANASYAAQCSVSYSNIATLLRSNVIVNTGNLQFTAAAGGVLTNAQMSLGQVVFLCAYPAS